MNVDIKKTGIDPTLSDRLLRAITGRHNTVTVTMFNMTRRCLQGIMEAFEGSAFIKAGCASGWRFRFADGVTAERANTRLRMFTETDSEHIMVRTRVQNFSGACADVPPMRICLSRVQHIDSASQPALPIVSRQFEYTCVYASRGYEYIARVATPWTDPETNSGGSASSLEESEAALMDKQTNEFTVRFTLRDFEHPMLYHSLNAVHRMLGCFRRDLCLAVGAEDDPTAALLTL